LAARIRACRRAAAGRQPLGDGLHRTWPANTLSPSTPRAGGGAAPAGRRLSSSVTSPPGCVRSCWMAC